MFKVEQPCGQMSLDPNDEQNASTEEKVGNDDELVKHMSNLPAFLQKAGDRSSVQEKALNFGVLDWKRLEKWKYNERMPTKCHHKKSSSSIGSGYAATGPPKISANLRKQQPPSRLSSSSFSQEKHLRSNTSSAHTPHLNLLKMERRNISHEQETYFGRKLTFNQEDEASRGSSITGRQNSHQKVESWDRSSEKNVTVKSNEAKRVVQVDRLALNEGTHGFSLPSNDVTNVHVRKSVNRLDDRVDPQKFGASRASDLDDCRSSFPKSNLVSSRQSDVKNLITHETTVKPSFSAEVAKGSEANVSKQPTAKSRHTSPTRFNFGIAKLRQSFSFKESSSVPQSDPMMEVSFDNIDKNKTASSNTSRSSPLRRLLDPLLKSKRSQSFGIAPPTNGTLNSRTIPTQRPSQDKKSLEPPRQGFLQLTLKNGFPSFKLMLDNSSGDVLAAVGNKFPPFEKSDHSMLYTFYSIHEIRKQSTNWLQKTTSKSCGLGFTVVGQMKISSSSQCATRECVLYGVERAQMDKQEELVAIVVQNSSRRLKDVVSNDGRRSKQEKCTPHCVSGATSDKGEDKLSDNNVVILPGGVHGIPNKGVHSSLISRWKSSGSCDCGGWDVGCKLQVLTNQIKPGCHNLETSSVSSSRHDSVSLFAQGRERKGRPVLNMEAIGNGLHSLELDSSMPLLEAFATCVALMTCKKFSDILDTNIPENLVKVIADKKNSSTPATKFQAKARAKYASLFPQSPVGRI